MLLIQTGSMSNPFLDLGTLQRLYEGRVVDHSMESSYISLDQVSTERSCPFI